MEDIQDTNKTTTPEMREQWNGFLDHLDKQGMAGNSSLDDPRVANAQMEMYRQINPDFSITADHIPTIQNEQQVLRNGGAFGSLAPEHLQAIQGGFNPGFANRPVNQTGQLDAATSQLYYPVSKEHGTEIEKYASTLGPVPVNDKAIAPSNSVVSIPSGEKGIPITEDKTITQPGEKQIVNNSDQLKNNNENIGDEENVPVVNQKQRNMLYKKYGKGTEDVVDMPEWVKFKPQDATQSFGNLATKSAKRLGLKPSVLFASTIVEGAKGLSGAGENKGEEDWSGDEKYPVSGFVNFGLDNFSDKYPELVKKGYLSKDFAQNFTKSVQTNEQKKKVNSANFKTVDAAIEAKAAMIKDLQDQTDGFAKMNGIKLSDRARDFFTLVGYNGGEGSMKKMMISYNNGGFLKNDDFIINRPTESWKSIHREVAKRIRGADVLRGEKLLE